MFHIVIITFQIELKIDFISFCRNYRQTCKQLSGLDLTAWESDEEPEFTTEASEAEEETVAPLLEGINESVIKAAIEKAKADMNERAQFEYQAWLNGNSFVCFFFIKLICFK